jgi:hypothetical protein
MQHAPPPCKRFVRGEDHRPLLAMSIVHDVEEHVGSIGAVREIADLVDDQYEWMYITGEDFSQPTGAECRGEVVDQFRGGDEERVEAILDGPVGHGNGEMRLPASRFSAEDHATALGHEIWGECRAEERESDGRLHREIEIVDRFKEGEMGPTHHAGDARLLPLRDLFGNEEGEEIAVAPLLPFGALDQVAPRAARIGQVQALE